MLRDLGPALSPFSSWLFLQGLETLPLRQRRHSENALKVAQFLAQHPLVSWVVYPGLTKNPNHKIAAKYLNGNYGGLVGFGIKGAKNQDANLRIRKVSRTLQTSATQEPHRTPLNNPPTITKQEQEATGVTEDYIRLSIGLEDPEDIIEDLDQALKTAAKP